MPSVASHQYQRRLRQAQAQAQAARQEVAQLQRQIQAQQQQQQQQIAALLHTTATALAAANADQQLVLLNQRFLELFQIPGTVADYLGWSLPQLLRQGAVVFQHLDATLRQLKQAIDSQTPLTGVVLRLTDTKVIELSYLPLVADGQTTLHLWNCQDVTQQHQLQHATQQLSQLAGYSPHPLICFGPDAQPLYANTAANKVLSCLRLREYAAAHDWLRANLKEALLTGQLQRHEAHLAGHYYQWMLVPLPDQACVNVYLTDLTTQHEHATRLQQSENLLGRIAATIPHLTFVYEVQERRIVYCNERAEQQIGYSEHQLISMGSQVGQLVHPEDKPLLDQHWLLMRQAQDREIRTVEFRQVKADGSLIYLRMYTTPFERDEEGLVRLAVGATLDVTQEQQLLAHRRAFNRLLAQQNQLIRQILNTSPHLIFLQSLDGTFSMVNQATAALFGTHPVQLVRRWPAAQARQQQPGLLLEAAEAAALFANRQETLTEEQYGPSARWYQVLRRPFRLPDGTPQLLVIGSDVTDLKQTQLELEKAKDTAERTARVKEDFLANMSHEIRTPMHGILGVSGLLAQTELNPEQHEHLRHIRESAEHLLVVINDVLAISQLGTGKIKLETRLFDLREVLQLCHDSVRPRAQEKGIGIYLSLPEARTPTQVLGDQYRLSQVLLNLLGNAVKFTQQGYVRLVCRPVAPAAAGLLTFQFEVEDTGIGIPAAQLHRVFEAFTQASASTAREYGGTGLGLSISKGLVDLLGGTLTVESEEGQGSRFRVELSFAQPTELMTIRPAKSTNPAPEVRRLGPHRLLLVEDNQVNQFLTNKLLSNWGLQTDTAASGLEALRLFQENRYALILMDIQMPGMDGIATAEHMRHQLPPDAIMPPIVALTAHALPNEARRFRQAGFDAYLSKPFHETALYNLLARLLPNPAVAAAPLFDLAALRQIAQGDEQFVRHMIQLFIKTVPPALDKLAAYYQQRDWARVSSMAHHLKSSFHSLRILSIADTLRTLETDTDNLLGNDQHAAELIHHLHTVTTEVIQQLTHHLEAEI